MLLVTVFKEIWVLIYFCVVIFRRLSTLNKCAVMRIGTPAKKPVSEISNSYKFIKINYCWQRGEMSV